MWIFGRRMFLVANTVGHAVIALAFGYYLSHSRCAVEFTAGGNSSAVLRAVQTGSGFEGG